MVRLLSFSEINSLRDLGKSTVGVRIEHTGVEVDAFVPLLQAVGPLTVNIVFVGHVVGTSDFFPVVAAHELKALTRELGEVVVGFEAESHLESPPRPGFVHLAVALGIIATVVGFEGVGEEVVGESAIERAVDNVVSLVDDALAVSVKSSSSELRRSIGRKILPSHEIKEIELVLFLPLTRMAPVVMMVRLNSLKNLRQHI